MSMRSFDAKAHANRLRGNDRGRFTHQQHTAADFTLEDPYQPSLGDWDFRDHERFENEHGDLLRLVHYVDGKVTDGMDGSPAVVKFFDDGGRVEKRYRHGVLHNGSGMYPSIARYRADGTMFSQSRGYYLDTGHNKKFIHHDSPDGQQGSFQQWTDRWISRREQHGVTCTLDPFKPATVVEKIDGRRHLGFRNSKGLLHCPAPGHPSNTGYYPDGSLEYVSFHENGNEINGPRKVHEEIFYPDGHVKAIHAAYPNTDHYSSWKRVSFTSHYFEQPRPVEQEITGELTTAEILDRIGPDNSLTVRVRVPLAKQKSNDLLSAAGVHCPGARQRSASLAPIKRNRTVFDVIVDASEIVSNWDATARENPHSQEAYLSARIHEQRSSHTNYKKDQP